MIVNALAASMGSKTEYRYQAHNIMAREVRTDIIYCVVTCNIYYNFMYLKTLKIRCKWHVTVADVGSGPYLSASGVLQGLRGLP